MGLLVMIALLSLFVIPLIRTSGVTRRNHDSSSTHRQVTVRRVTCVIRAVAWCFAAPAGVMIVFVAIAGGLDRDWKPFEFGHRWTPPKLSTMVHPINPLNQLEKDQDSDFARNRPKWIAEGDQTSDDIRRVVLSSRLWSTEAEAIQDIQAKAAAMIREDFERRHHGPFSSAGQYFLSEEQLVDVAVKERYVERIEQDFGKFSSPMNRVWWQIEISPLVRTEIYPAWKAAVVRHRVLMVAAALALLTFAANVVALSETLRQLRRSSTVRATT